MPPVFLQNLALSERPAELAEVLAALSHFAVDFCPSDRGLDFGARTDDVRVIEKTQNILLAIAGNLARCEIRECRPECSALAQHDDPGKTRLEAFEHEHFPKGACVALHDPPLRVVVLPHDRTAFRPWAAMTLEGSHCKALCRGGVSLDVSNTCA